MPTRKILSSLRTDIRKTRQLHFLLTSLAIYSIVLALIFRFADSYVLHFINLSILLLALLQVAHWLLKKPVSERQILRFIDQHFSELENSSELLLDNSISSLGVIQRKRIESIINELNNKNKLYHSLPTLPGQSILRTFASGFFIALVITFIPSNGQTELTKELDEESKIKQSEEIVLTQTLMIETPSSYTQIESIVHQSLTTKIMEQSIVQWQLKFSQQVASVALDFVNRESVKLIKNKNNIWTGSIVVDKTLIYQLNIDSPHNYQNLNKYRLEMIDDVGPIITVIEPVNSITELPANAADVVFKRNIQLSIIDDFSIETANIIITLAKGSGENVRFREQSINLMNNVAITDQSKNELKLAYELDLKSLGMEIGDELYFRIESADNQLPKANLSRSSSYIIRWPDPEMMASEEMGSMMMKVMPDFFRSQRQIIIDTEKLISEKNTIQKEQYESHSQDIAESQKVLRLRYGQFLGEEYESGISSNLSGMIASLAEQAMAKEEHDEKAVNSAKENAVDEHGHVHQENAAADKALKINNIMDVMTTFGHLHDQPEQSTLLDEKTKKLLKVALASMWEAELRLRLIQPVDALPSEYKALEFIKKAQQSERIYLQRVGFEPPPLKEERRLTAELDDIKSTVESRFDKLNKQQQQYLFIIQSLSRLDTSLNITDQLNNLEQELKIHINKNDNYLEALADLKILLQQTECQSCKNSLVQSLWKLIPDSHDKVAVKGKWKDPLSESYRQQNNQTDKYNQTNKYNKVREGNH